MAALPHPLGWDASDWGNWFEQQGAPRYRAAQVFRWLHQKAELDPERMTNVDKATRAWSGNDPAAMRIALAVLR